VAIGVASMRDEAGHDARAPIRGKGASAVFRVTIFALTTAVELFAGLRSQPIPQLFAGQDKFEHVIGFFCLGLGLLFLRGSIRRATFFGVCSAMAIFIEVAQAWVPHRTASAMDAVAGVVGAGLAWYCRGRPG